MNVPVSPPRTVPELGEAVRSAVGPAIAVGGGTKPALIPPDAAAIPLFNLNGIVEYEPSEYTFTALAGTSVREITVALAQHGQYLPFDPLLVESGSTLGGVVAANASGPGRLRFGGVRDFVIGVRFFDGAGQLLRGGGKVVKNAAGFDFPKLMAGSMGRLAVLAELSFKVFPAPESRMTAVVQCRDLADAVERTCFAASQNWEVEALELMPPGRLALRLMGDSTPLAARMAKVLEKLARPAEILSDSAADHFWRETTEFSWISPGSLLVKIPLTPRQVMQFDALLGSACRRYSQAANVAYVSWTETPESLHQILKSAGCSGIVWRGSGRPLRLGQPGPSMEAMVKGIFDPGATFPPFPDA